MSLYSKVVWSEGMFLNPQHFQQQERYFERYFNTRLAGYDNLWGWSHLSIDTELLKLGKISLNQGSGVFPDGTPFDFPSVDNLPPVKQIPVGLYNVVVYLGIPVRRNNIHEVSNGDDDESLTRYQKETIDAQDVSLNVNHTANVDIGQLKYRLLLESEDRSGYTCIGVLRISETRDDKSIVIDEGYIPPVQNIHIATSLSHFLNELLGLIHQRAESIASRISDARQGRAAEINDYLLLQLLNRIEPLLQHFSQSAQISPLVFYRELVQFAGELNTFTSDNKRASQLASYHYDDLRASFFPLMDNLRQSLSTVYEQTAVSLAMQEKRYGIRVVTLTDRSLLNTSTFVLAAKADINEAQLRQHFPAQVKIGPVELIRPLVNAAMPGIALKPMPVAPRQIPYHTGYVYFELDLASELWQKLTQSGGMAVHIGGDFPNLMMELWAIRNS